MFRIFCISILFSGLFVGCLKVGPSGGSETNLNVASPKQSKSIPDKQVNLNPNRIVDLSHLTEQYPDMVRLTIVSEGVSGVSMTREEAQNMGRVTIGGPGVRGYYTYVVFLSNGSEVQGRF